MTFVMKKDNLEYGTNSLASLKKFTEELKLPKLPDDYAQFLIETNGGQPKNKMIHYMENGLKTYTEILELFGVTHKKVYSTLIEHKKYSLGIIPDLFLQTGSDMCGNKICIDLYKDSYGEICIVDHDFNCDDEDKMHYDKKDFEGAIVKISSSFTSFFKDLKYYEQWEETYTDVVCDNYNIDELKKLLSGGLDPNTKNNRKITLVRKCATLNNVEMLKILHSFKASFEDSLEAAIYCSAENAALYIIENGLDKDIDDLTSLNYLLYLAAERNLVKVGADLIKKGADVNFIFQDLSILAYVEDNQDCIEFKNLLLSHGAKSIYIDQ